MAKLNNGDHAPDFELPWTGEGDFKLSDRRGEWIVLAFYPADNSAVCTKQFCNYRAEGDKIEGLDAEIIGVSPQDVSSHESFIADNKLNVPLVSDPDLKAAEAYGVTLGNNIRRSVFVIDPDGKIRFRNVKLLGLTYDDADSIQDAFEQAKENAKAA
ncbi:MAG: peroxiredoxin [Solirubrobacterales bacterium]